MKGLLRNNLYAAEGSLKTMVLISFITMIAIAIGCFFYPIGNIVVTPCVSGLFGGFGALTGTAIQKDVNCKWNKFELTMPVSRKDVVSARYLSFLIYILLGLFMAILCIFLFYVASGSINLERVSYSFAFGMTFALLIPTFLYPLVLIFGTDKNEMLLFVSIFLALGLYFVGSVLVSPFLKRFEYPNLIFRISFIIVSIGLFVLSYIFSLLYYRRKEL